MTDERMKISIDTRLIGTANAYLNGIRTIFLKSLITNSSFCLWLSSSDATTIWKPLNAGFAGELAMHALSALYNAVAFKYSVPALEGYMRRVSLNSP